MVTVGPARPSNQSSEIRFKELLHFHQVFRPTILLSVILPVFKLCQDFPVCWWWNVQRHYESYRDDLPTSCRRLWPAWKVKNDEEDASVANKHILVYVKNVHKCSGSLHPFSQMDSRNSIILETIWKKNSFRCQVNGNDSLLTVRLRLDP